MTGTRILVVEDNALNRSLLREVLQHRGHQVFEASGAEEGRAILKNLTPDLVLMDIQLPGEGGEALLAEIRQNPNLTHLPVLAVTALAMAGDRERLIGVGFNGYISKPINVRTIGAELESYLPMTNR